MIFICNHDPYGRSRYVYTFRSRCEEDDSVLLDDEATKIIVNTKGTVGDIGGDLKAVIDYLASGAVSTDYTRALDAEVESVKSDEKVRLQFMLLIEAYARERSMGKFMHVVSLIRGVINEFTVAQMSKLFKMSEKDCAAVVEVLKAHPDWDDEQVAEQIYWEEWQ